MAVLDSSEAEEPETGVDVDSDMLDWELLYRDHAARLRRLIERRVPHAAVEDVLQETFVRAYRSRHRLDLSRPLFPLLATLARRSSIQWYRSHQPLPVVGWETADERNAGDFPGSDEHLIGYVRARRVADVLARLTPRHRRILYLHGVHDYGCDTIAAADELSEKAVRSALDRARANFRRTYRSRADGPFVAVGLRHGWLRLRQRVDGLRLEGCERLGFLAASAAVSAVVGVLAVTPHAPMALRPTTSATPGGSSAVETATASPRLATTAAPPTHGTVPVDRLTLATTASAPDGPRQAAPPVNVRASSSLVNTPGSSTMSVDVKIENPVIGGTTRAGSTVYCDRAQIATLECMLLRLLPAPT